MKPLGQKPVRFPCKIDHHLHEKHRKVKNWWEGGDIGTVENKAAANRDARQEIKAELDAAGG